MYDPDETPREHIANAITILETTDVIGIEDAGAVQDRFAAALSRMLGRTPERRAVLAADYELARCRRNASLTYARQALEYLDAPSTPTPRQAGA